MTAKLGTRAVVRRVEPGAFARCARCGTPILYSAWKRQRKVIANIYGPNGKWSHVSHFHFDCYVEAGEPHGAAS